MQLLGEHDIHRLVVCEPHYGGRFVTDRMMPVGILTQTDIVRALTAQLGATVAAGEAPLAEDAPAGS
jgi:CBS domain-containing protein